MSDDLYAAPTADLDNSANAATVQASSWSAKGRLGVLSYLAHSLVLLLLGMVVFGVIYAIGIAMIGGMPESMDSINWASPVIIVLGIVVVLVYIAFIYITFCMMIKRLHDRNHSGWWSLALAVASIIPFVNIVSIFGFLYVILWPGHKTGNRFGGQRQTKGWEKVLGIVYLVLIIGGILAAVVGGGAALFMNAG